MEDNQLNQNNNEKEENTKKRKSKKRRKLFKSRQFVIIIAFSTIMALSIVQAFESTKPSLATMEFLEFQQHVENNNVQSVAYTKSEDVFVVILNDGTSEKVISPQHETFRLELLEAGINLSVQESTVFDAVLTIISEIPILILITLIAFSISGTLTQMSTSLYRLIKPDETVKFSDVAGMSETKKEVEFAVKQIINRKHLADMGAVPTRGIILEGPPGTGKTMLAKAIAGEANVPCISTSGSDFVEMFAGLGASRVRGLWELAETNAPCVIFIDEIDSVGRRRSGASDGASTESNQTLNALLQKMDGIGANAGIFVVAATNRISDLDPALLRPGRFDKHLYVGNPRKKSDRDEIITVHLANKKTEPSDKLEFINKISRLLYGMSGAEISQVLNESVLISLGDGRNGIINPLDVDEAGMKLFSSGVRTEHTCEEDKIVTAVHEAGHTVAHWLHNRKVAKVSVISYSSGVGGVTMRDTDDMGDKKLKTAKEILEDIQVLVAGKVAEELLLGEASIGCSNDLEKASLLAYEYVSTFGMLEGQLINARAVQTQLGIPSSTEEIIERANKVMVEQYEEIKLLLGTPEKIEEIINLKERLLIEETIIF